MPRHSLKTIDGNKGLDNKMSRTTKANKDRLPDKRRRREAKKEIYTDGHGDGDFDE